MTTNHNLNAIGLVDSPYKDKFAIPRQPGLAPSVISRLVFTGEYANPDAFRGLDQFSHIWIIFKFHLIPEDKWQPLIRPPRLGGNKKVGVFASRSTFRPNSLGQSVVKIENQYQAGNEYVIEVSGADLVNGTPIFDIKPYVPYSDSQSGAKAGYATDTPQVTNVVFSQDAESFCQRFSCQYPGLEQNLTEILAQDPRPSYRKGEVDDRVYGMRFYDLNVKWKVVNTVLEVILIEEFK